MRRRLGLALALMALAAPARAASPSDLDELLAQSIVSTPSKGSETDTTAPATSSVISAEELRRHGIRSLDEALNYLSLGMATSTPAHTAEIGARGVQINGDYGNHVLLLIDGHAVNEPWNGTAYFERGAGIPLEVIDHIEVVLGPGSVLYGSQAMLGVINVVTKRAKDFRGTRLIAEAEAVFPNARGGSVGGPAGLGAGFRVGAGYGRELSIGGRRSEFTLTLDYYRSKGPAWQLGPQSGYIDSVTSEPLDFGPNSSPGTWGGTIRRANYVEAPAGYLRFASGDFQASLRASAYKRSMAYPESLTAYSADFDDPFNQELDRFVNLDLSQRFVLSSRVELIARAYGDLYTYEWHNRASAAETCPEGLLNGCSRYLEGIGRMFGGEVRARVQWPILRASTVLGVDAKYRNVEDNLTINGRAGPGTPTPHGETRSDGLVAPYIAQSFSPTSFLDVNLGLRLDQDTRFGSALSPRSALGVTPWRGGRLKLIYAEAFRAPSAYELTYSDPNAQLAAKKLDPESVRSLEASVEQRFGKHRILFGVFRSWWSGLVGGAPLTEEEIASAIERGELSASAFEAYVRKNLGRIDNVGLNAAYEGTAADDRLRFGVNVTAANTRGDPGDGSGASVLHVAPQSFGNARISYALAAPLPTLAAAVRYTDTVLTDRYYDGGFARRPTVPPAVSLRFTVTGVVASLPGLRYRAGAQYSFARSQPYLIGPEIYARDETARAELAPNRRLQGFVGLEYAFDEAE